MFLKIELRNFRSFDHVILDLSRKEREAKKLAIIYGENGSGKTNLMSAFVMLTELLNTMNVRDRYEFMLSRMSTLPDEEIRDQITKQISEGMRDIKAIINDNRMVDCSEPIAARYDFIIGGSVGSYYIELGSDEIICERLEYRLNSRKGVLFDCSGKQLYINPIVVNNKEFLNDIKLTAKRYWGKHSLLAIFMHEIDDKSKAYAEDNISANLQDVLYEFKLISGNIRQGSKTWKRVRSPISVFVTPIEGTISIDEESILDDVERLFSTFYSSIDSNVKRLYYKRTYSENIIEYKLYIERLLADSYRKLDFSRESNGNHKLLDLLCYFIVASFQGIVVLDEADSGIHDLLFKKIMQEVNEEIRGQIIMTTHNTMLMEANISNGSFYIISEEVGCHKTIKSIPDYDKRTYLGNNIRNKYLNNEYNGLPKVEKINFKELVHYMMDVIQKRIIQK